MKNVSLLLYLVLLYGCYEKRSSIKTGLEGKILPEFNMLLVDSVTYFNTNKIPFGKPVVLYYFNPRCPYCRAQMGEIIEEISSLKDIRFYVFTTWPFGEMKNFYTHYQLQKYTNIVVGVDYTNFFVDYFKVSAVPYMAIYSKDKKLNEVFMGKIYSKQIIEVANF